jgi:hypothetical protein
MRKPLSGRTGEKFVWLGLMAVGLRLLRARVGRGHANPNLV